MIMDEQIDELFAELMPGGWDDVDRWLLRNWMGSILAIERQAAATAERNRLLDKCLVIFDFAIENWYWDKENKCVVEIKRRIEALRHE